jgi:hypothetical protein
MLMDLMQDLRGQSVKERNSILEVTMINTDCIAGTRHVNLRKNDSILLYS